MMSGGGYSSLDDPKASGSVPAATGPDPPAIRFTDSNLQTFPPSEARGKISGAYRPPTDADGQISRPRLPCPSRFSSDLTGSPGRGGVFADTFSSKAGGGGGGGGGRGGGAGSDDAAQGGWFRLLSVAAYKPYFDVDTSDVVERIWESVFPFRGTFTEKTSENPDLYGPFWTCTTLIFVAASIATFVTYLSHKWHKKEWSYDINLVTWSAGLFYGYVTFVPLLLYAILKYFSAPAGLVQLWCLYGYSLFIFIPASLLSIVPIEIFRWVIAGAAGFMSATFVAVNLRAHIVNSGERWFLIVAGIFLLQLGLAVLLKLYFFTITV
ncbi:Protein YIPF1-like protein [Dichanthelium oligosanthes]|uniref:Protein YIP n=2 Tax=Paniceae TaxID=147428 RepID=A0A1E5VRE2_9POAL|nr:Protein YIPF1-like protein [Dichanthelium oligosanthes]